jgi:hypothetical protein
MKHRSVVAFVLLAATLAAVPQASQDLSELKSALAARVRTEIWSAFLNLNGRGGATQSAPRSTQHTLASCTNAPAGPSAKRSSAPARAAAQAGASAEVEGARHFEAEELAMMLTPPAENVEGKMEVEAVEELKELGKVLKTPAREILPAQEMAMIIPPGEAPDSVLTSRLTSADAETKAARSRSRRAESEARATYVATAFNERGVEFRKVGDVMRFQFNNSLIKDGVAIPLSVPAPKAKATKVKRQQTTTNVTAPAVTTKQLACLALELGRVVAPDVDTE